MTDRTDLVLAVDVGGTKLAAGLVDAQGTVVAADRVPTPQAVDAETTWAALRDLTDGLLAAAGRPDVIGVGIGSGGPMRWPSGEVSPLNIPGWRDFPLRERFTELLPGRPVRIHNDAVALAIAEHWRGAGRGVADLLGMVVSTGVGGGLVLGGRVVDGATGNAGHVGHVVVDPAGPPCACGGVGCLEAVARGPALAAWAVDRGWRDGQPPARQTARELGRDATAGDQVAVAAFERAGQALGVAIASVAAVCDLELVVIGGGVVQVGDLLLGPLRVTLGQHAGLEFTRRTRVAPAAFGQVAGLVGAAALVHRADRYWSPGSPRPRS